MVSGSFCLQSIKNHMSRTSISTNDVHLDFMNVVVPDYKSRMSVSVTLSGVKQNIHQWLSFYATLFSATPYSIQIKWNKRDLLTGTSSCVKVVCAPMSSSSCLIFRPDCGLAGEFLRLSSPSWLSFGKGLSLKLLCEDAYNNITWNKMRCGWLNSIISRCLSFALNGCVTIVKN